METYKTWIRRNKDCVHSLESLATGLTWFLPERFSKSEIGPEAVTTFLGIITAINAHIIDTPPTWLSGGSVEPSSFPYPLCISTLKDLESLVEVVAQQVYGDDKKWHFIAIMEAAKVVVRLALLRSSGWKMLLHGGETPNDENSKQNSEHFMAYAGRSKQGRHGPPNPEGKALFALSRFGENARHRYQISNHSTTVVARATPIIFPESDLRSSLFAMGEVLHIARPLVYVLFIRKYGIQSWIPWILSMALDVAGMGIVSFVTATSDNANAKQLLLSDSENNELKRRKLMWALYLMRDPCYSKYTRQKLKSTEKLLEPVPVIGSLAGKIIELMVGVQTRYTYVSGS